jgi:hypothetical protein
MAESHFGTLRARFDDVIAWAASSTSTAPPLEFSPGTRDHLLPSAPPRRTGAFPSPPGSPGAGCAASGWGKPPAPWRRQAYASSCTPAVRRALAVPTRHSTRGGRIYAPHTGAAPVWRSPACAREAPTHARRCCWACATTATSSSRAAAASSSPTATGTGCRTRALRWTPSFPAGRSSSRSRSAAAPCLRSCLRTVVGWVGGADVAADPGGAARWWWDRVRSSAGAGLHRWSVALV